MVLIDDNIRQATSLSSSSNSLSNHKVKRLRQDEESPERPPQRRSKVPMTNRERAQKSRDRKKQYTDVLEQKIEALEQQIGLLSVELEKYRK